MNNHNEAFLKHMVDQIKIVYTKHQDNTYIAASPQQYPNIQGIGTSKDTAHDNLILQIKEQIKKYHPLY